MRTSQDVAEICAARYFEQLRPVERMIGEEEFIANDCVTIADCVAMATLHYASDLYDVPIPRDCPKLTRWYAGFAKRPSAASPRYPEAKRAKALGLMAQTRASITI